MINFEPCIRNFKSNGYAQVYIRAIKVKEVQYISTPYAVTSSQVEKNKVTDYAIIAEVVDPIGIKTKDVPPLKINLRTLFANNSSSAKA